MKPSPVRLSARADKNASGRASASRRRMSTSLQARTKGCFPFFYRVQHHPQAVEAPGKVGQERFRPRLRKPAGENHRLRGRSERHILSSQRILHDAKVVET